MVVMKAGTNSKRGVQKRSARRGRNLASDVAMPDVATVVSELPHAGTRSDEVLVLQPDCTARSAESLKISLMEKLAASEAVSIGIAEVERVDTVCLQLLVAFVRDRRQAGRSVVWQGSSASLLQAATLLGLTSVLGVAVAG